MIKAKKLAWDRNLCAQWYGMPDDLYYIIWDNHKKVARFQACLHAPELSDDGLLAIGGYCDTLEEAKGNAQKHFDKVHAAMTEPSSKNLTCADPEALQKVASELSKKKVTIKLEYYKPVVRPLVWEDTLLKSQTKVASIKLVITYDSGYDRWFAKAIDKFAESMHIASSRDRDILKRECQRWIEEIVFGVIDKEVEGVTL